MKLGLGTVQFGVDYGISNPDGKTNLKTVREILDVAERNDIRIIDTAVSYGESESVLGEALRQQHAFKIVTKTPRFIEANPAERASLLVQSVNQSLKRLRVPSLYGLLIHHADDLICNSGTILMECMKELKRQGIIKKIGVSVYTAAQIDLILDKHEIDLIQVPINVLDQRLLRSGHLSRLNTEGVEIHARSAFLQGLLLMDPFALPGHFNSIQQHLVNYRNWLKQLDLTPLQAALGFVLGLDEINTVICGVNNEKQLVELCNLQTPFTQDDFAPFAISDEIMLNPSLWQF